MLEASGNIAIDGRSVQVIQACTNTFVQHIAVGATLSLVRWGQALVTLYSLDWVAIQEEYLAVLHKPAHGQADLVGVAETRML